MTVFIDTFLTRFGDLTGSIYIGIGTLLGIGIGFMPIISIPIAGILSLVGILSTTIFWTPQTFD